MSFCRRSLRLSLSRPVEPLPPGTTFEEMLFIAQLKEAGIPELQAARQES